MNVQRFLNERGVPFEVMEHEPTYSALRMAHALHVPGDEVAKPVILKTDGRYVMALVPAPCRIDMGKAKQALHTDTCALADERDFARLEHPQVADLAARA